jgi:hypothetical protein
MVAGMNNEFRQFPYNCRFSTDKLNLFDTHTKQLR